MKKLGVTHPIPTKFAKRIYNENKNVFIGKKFLMKASVGDKFLIYESQGAKAFTGWADIKFIGKVETSQIWGKFGKKLMVNFEEFKEYSKGKKEMTIIEFENFQKFNKPVVPKRYITIGGKYIYENELKSIDKSKG